MHFMFEKKGWDHLITCETYHFPILSRFPPPLVPVANFTSVYRNDSALYLRNDPYETSDAVFGVKKTLVVDFEPADEATAKRYSVEIGTSVLRHDFVLVSEKEASDLRDRKSKEALEALGRKVKLLDGLPVPDVD